MRVASGRHEKPTSLLAEFCSARGTLGVPDEVRATAASGVIDYFGVAIAGSADPEVSILRSWLRESSPPGAATVLGGTPSYTAAAAFANSAAGHVLDFDDYSDAVRGHPTTVVLPAVLALAQTVGATTSEIFDAYVVGVEVEAALGRALNPLHYERGWHPTATLGTFGAAAGASRLLSLDGDTTRRALAIAASFASGTKGGFGTFTKACQVGFASYKGVLAADLARRGISASEEAFEGTFSFPSVYDGRGSVDWSPLQQLGRHWNLVAPGLTFKLYPCCASAHGAIDAAAELATQRSVSRDDIAAVDVYVHPRRIPHTDRPSPRTALEAKFSMQYLVAVALARGTVTFEDFTAHALADPEIAELTGRVRLHELPAEEQFVPPGRLECFAARVDLRLKSGNVVSHSVDAPRGSDPRFPIAESELRGKFLNAAGQRLSTEAAGNVYLGLVAWIDGDEPLGDLLSSVELALRQPISAAVGTTGP